MAETSSHTGAATDRAVQGALVEPSPMHIDAGGANDYDQLVWCALCIILLAINSLVLAVDVLFLPDIDLSGLQILTSLSAVCVLLYAFIWEA